MYHILKVCHVCQPEATVAVNWEQAPEQAGALLRHAEGPRTEHAGALGKGVHHGVGMDAGQRGC